MSITAPEYVGDTITLQQGAWTFTCTMESDDDSDAPWDREEGHGPVHQRRRWEDGSGNPIKEPGELHLGNGWFYDYQEACRIARRDGWDAKPYNTGQETKRQQAAKAARADYERLRDWCNDEWSYVGFIVRLKHAVTGVELASSSLWGIESDCGSYGDTVCAELMEQCINEARETLTHLATIAI